MGYAVITGCNSGIGHAFAQLLDKEGYDVIAIDSDFDENMSALRCSRYQLDVSSEASIAKFKASFVMDEPVDILLNIAGIMSPKEADSLNEVSYETLLKTFSVNTFGPLLLTQALLPNLTKSKAAKVGIMSSRVGSIADNSTGGSYAYRASKAALNSIGKSLSVDLKEKGIAVVLMHPGFVKTGLDTSGDTHKLKEAIEPEEAARKLWELLKRKGMEDSGRFWHREGQELPW